MTEDRPRRRAHRIPVPEVEPLIGSDRYDYADSFTVGIDASDPRSSEEFARAALEEAPPAVRRTVSVAHRHVLRLRLGSPTSSEHLLGWRIAISEPDVIHLEAVSPLLGRGAIVGRRPEPTRVVVTTYLFFSRPALGRAVWALVGPLHRRIAPVLLDHAAAAGDRAALETGGRRGVTTVGRRWSGRTSS